MLGLRVQDVCWAWLPENNRRSQVLGKPHPQMPTTDPLLIANAHIYVFFHAFRSLMILMPPLDMV